MRSPGGGQLRAVAAALLCLAATACATPQTDWLREHPDAVLRQGAVVDPVFHAQRTKECGPAALAMVLGQSGIPSDPDDLVEEVYNPGREGSLTPAIIAGARRHGRIAYPVHHLSALLGELSEGRPVLVLQNLGLEMHPRWHYAVAVGYDLDAEEITLHSGTTPYLRMPLTTFEHTWKRGDHWAIVALAPGEFPRTVDEGVYMRAVAGVERAGNVSAAAEAYAAAHERWPDNLVALMGLGNARYALGEREAAADAFREASRRHPDSAPAANNLAHVLGELGDLDAAERAARRAVELGSDDAEAYHETLDEILEAKGRATPAPSS